MGLWLGLRLRGQRERKRQVEPAEAAGPEEDPRPCEQNIPALPSRQREAALPASGMSHLA